MIQQALNKVFGTGASKFMAYADMGNLLLLSFGLSVLIATQGFTGASLGKTQSFHDTGCLKDSPSQQSEEGTLGLATT